MVKGVVENLASHANGAESEEGLTRATISPATIVITDQAAQTQDIALLNRDDDNAHRAADVIDHQALQKEVEVRREIQSMTVKSVEFFAGRNLTITTAENTQAGQFNATDKTSGLRRFDATGNSVGKREQDQAQQTTATSHTASQIVSLGQGGENNNEGSVS
jgi:hypothetical protein